MPGGIFKSLSRFPKETYKTLAREKSMGIELKRCILAWGQGLTQRPLELFSSSDLMIKYQQKEKMRMR